MPPVVAAVAASAIASSIAAIPLGALAGGAFVGLGLSSATLGAIGGGIVAFGINTLGSAVLSKKPKMRGDNGLADQGLKQTIRASDDTQKIIYGRSRIGGTLAYVETASVGPDSDGISQTGDNLFLHMMLMHAGHEVDAFEEIYINDELVTLDGSGFVNESPYKKDGKSYIRILTHLGSDSQTADSVAVTEAPSWTTSHRLRGIAYSYVRMQWNPDVFTSGIPTINVVLRGKKVYDPRTTLTVWSDNAALCIRDYLFARDAFNVPYGFGATVDEIDDSFTTSAANICEESITKLDASTIDRYTCNGVVDTANAPLDNIESMLSSMAGAITNTQGQFRIHAGAYDTPEATVVDESWLSGSIKSRNRVPRQDLFNAVRGLYIAPDKSWQSDDFPPIISSTYEAEDNGERIYKDIELPYTIDPEAAQRIAKLIQRKSREQISVTMPLNYKGLQFTVWDTIKVDNTTRGWSEKEFRIVNLTFDLTSGVVLQLREENSLSYSWTASDAEAIANAPDTNLPNAYTVEVPSGVTYDSREVSTAGGDSVYNLTLSWSPHSNAFVNNGGRFEIQYKLSADTDWLPSFSVSGDRTTSDIVSNSVNTSYDLRILAVNVVGVRSNWVEIDNAIIGSGGGVGATLDWGDWTTSASAFNDWADWTTTPTAFNDWGTF